MKICSISLQNIASIEGPFTLDFEAEPLYSAGLFAITGATGAGKSTLLDAICLALYNDTPRLSATKSNLSISDGTADVQVNNVKNLLRKGAVSGYARVAFIGIDGKKYKAEWQIRRAYNKLSGAIQQEEITLSCLTDETPFPEKRKTLVLEKIKELVGLSFDEFTKSVILAQGEFTSFLKANDDNRANILEKLTGTEIYTQISKQIFETNKQQQTALGLLQTQLDNVQCLGEEALIQLHQTLKFDEEALKALQNRLATLKAQEQWWTEVQRAQKQLAEARERQEKAIDDKERQAERFSEWAIIDQLQTIKADVLNKEKQSALLNTIQHSLKEKQAERARLLTDEQAFAKQKATAETEKESLQKAYRQGGTAL